MTRANDKIRIETVMSNPFHGCYQIHASVYRKSDGRTLFMTESPRKSTREEAVEWRDDLLESYGF